MTIEFIENQITVKRSNKLHKLIRGLAMIGEGMKHQHNERPESRRAVNQEVDFK